MEEENNNTEPALPVVIVTMQECRELGYCAGGVRRWLSDRGLNVSEFVLRGLPSSDFRGTGDGSGITVADYAEQKAAAAAQEEGVSDGQEQ